MSKKTSRRLQSPKPGTRGFWQWLFGTYRTG